MAFPDLDERSDALQGFIEQVKICLDQLRAWKDLWDIAEPGYYTDIPASEDTPFCMSSAPDASPTRAWQTAYTFPNIYHASAIILYHATFIHLRRMLHNVSHPANTFGLQTSPAEEFTSGVEICRSVEYHLQKAREGEGSFSFMFPLRMAWEAVEPVELIVRAWLQGVLQTIGTGPTGRWAVAGYLLNTKEIPLGPAKR